MALPDVVGVGVGERAGRPVIMAMARALTPELRRAAPEQLDGYQVEIDVTGEVSAL